MAFSDGRFDMNQFGIDKMLNEHFPNGIENGSNIIFLDPRLFNGHTDTDQFGTSFQNGLEEMNTAIGWATAASIVSGLVMVVAVVAIVYAIIDCLKKTGSAIPSYARLANHDIEKGSNRFPSANENGLTMSLAQVYPVIPDSEIKGATMDRFFGKIARERPIRFSRNQLEECTKGFTAHLGSGSYGVVYKGEFLDGLQVAVKWLKNRGDDQKVLQEQFIAEMSTLGRTYHNNLVRLCGFCFDPDFKALVYQFMERGSLNKILFGDNQDTIIKWEKLYEIAIGIAKGIAYLHEECRPTIIHYDIKPGNILLDKDLNPKVADFGLAKLRNPETSQSMAGFRGTREYAAPEFWNWNVVSHKCDVYSFGIMLFEILGRRRNFDEGAGGTRKYLSRWTWEMFEKSELGELFSLLDIEEKNIDKAERMSEVALWCI